MSTLHYYQGPKMYLLIEYFAALPRYSAEPLFLAPSPRPHTLPSSPLRTMSLGSALTLQFVLRRGFLIPRGGAPWTVVFLGLRFAWIAFCVSRPGFLAPMLARAAAFLTPASSLDTQRACSCRSKRR